VFGVFENRTQAYNLNKLVTDGIDFDIAYRFPLDSLNIPGRLALRGLFTWVGELSTTDSAGKVDRAGTSLGGGVPSHSGNFTATYTLGRFLGSLQARYTGPMRLDANLRDSQDPDYDPTRPNSVSQNHWP